MTSPMRALAGAIVSLLLVSSSYLGARIALGALDQHYTVNVTLGELGQGVVSGTDVKIRGVRVGSVGKTQLTDNFQARVELVLDEGVQIPLRSNFLVTGKTLLGEKQIEVLFDGPVEEGPYFISGSTIDDPARVVEVEDVVAALADIATSIDPDDLAVLFDDFFGAFDGLGPTIAKGIDEGAKAARLFALTLSDQITSTRGLSLVAEAIGPTGADFNRLASNVATGMPTLGENHAAITKLLKSLHGATRDLSAVFKVAKSDLERMIVGGDNVLRVLFHYRLEVAQVVEGIVTYTSAFEEGFKSPGVTGQAAYFQILLEGEDFQSAMCNGMTEEMRAQTPACQPQQASGQVRAALPWDMARPEIPSLSPLDAVLRRTLPGYQGGEAA